jgi:hypothetical protein
MRCHINKTVSKRQFGLSIRLATACFLLFSQMLLKAQTEKGRYLIGGSADLSESILNTTTTFNLGLAPTFGVFLFKNFVVGGTYSFSVSSVRTYNKNNQSHTTTTTIQPTVGPSLKYYIGKKALKGVAMINAGYTVYTQLKSSTNSSGTSITNYDGFSVRGLVGSAYFFNNYVSMESGLYLSASGFKGQLPTSRFGFSLGLYTFLDKKKQE